MNNTELNFLNPLELIENEFRTKGKNVSLYFQGGSIVVEGVKNFKKFDNNLMGDEGVNLAKQVLGRFGINEVKGFSPNSEIIEINISCGILENIPCGDNGELAESFSNDYDEQFFVLLDVIKQENPKLYAYINWKENLKSTKNR